MAVSFSHAQSGKERGNARCPILPVAEGHGEGDRREAMVEGQQRRAIAPPAAATPLPPPPRFATGMSDNGGRRRSDSTSTPTDPPACGPGGSRLVSNATHTTPHN